MVVIFGCGQMGKQLALNLDRQNREVTVIDPDLNSLNDLSSHHFRGLSVVGLGIDREVLNRAHVNEAEVFLAVSRDINTNIMSAQVAKLFFQVPRVIARIEDPEQIRFYQSLGIETISPTMQAVKHIENLI
jgi:trk system potassium uptake protein TrkA